MRYWCLRAGPPAFFDLQSTPARETSTTDDQALSLAHHSQVNSVLFTALRI